MSPKTIQAIGPADEMLSTMLPWLRINGRTKQMKTVRVLDFDIGCAKKIANTYPIKSPIKTNDGPLENIHNFSRSNFL